MVRAEMASAKKHFGNIWESDPLFAFSPVTSAKWVSIDRAFHEWAAECPRVKQYYEQVAQRRPRKRKRPNEAQ